MYRRPLPNSWEPCFFGRTDKVVLENDPKSKLRELRNGIEWQSGSLLDWEGNVVKV